MFTGNVMMLPGQEKRDFEVFAIETRSTDRGREGLVNEYTPIGELSAVLAQAKPEEIQRWRQLNHPVSHKLIMQHTPPFEILSGYKLCQKDTGQVFYVSTLPYDPGGLGHFTIIYLNDRRDVSN